MKRLFALFCLVMSLAPTSLAALTPDRTYPVYNTNCYSSYCYRHVNYHLTPSPNVPVSLHDYSRHRFLFLRSNSNPNIIFNNYQDYKEYQNRYRRYYSYPRYYYYY